MLCAAYFCSYGHTCEKENLMLKKKEVNYLLLRKASSRKLL